MATGTPASSAAARTRATVADVCSCFAWEKLMRTTFIPAAIIARKVSTRSQAGPSVATILVRFCSG